mmetsp:Transcript_17585/g.41868  ORF Transcript_17585/g.41868 Transcript_17585/m.41868 type:complete len:124 (+) Transcript_17585:737-1108(+)
MGRNRHVHRLWRQALGPLPPSRAQDRRAHSRNVSVGYSLGAEAYPTQGTSSSKLASAQAIPSAISECTTTQATPCADTECTATQAIPRPNSDVAQYPSSKRQNRATNTAVVLTTIQTQLTAKR